MELKIDYPMNNWHSIDAHLVCFGMNESQLKSLLWVVRLGGVGAAARQLNVTQPAITRRIQELEKELGAAVLRREGRNVVPTALGQSCLTGAERVLAEIAAMHVAASGKAVSGTVRIGVGEVVALTWLYRLHTRIEERYPNVRLEIDVDLSTRLVTKLRRHQIDIALLPGAVDIPGTHRTELGGCPLDWMSSPRLLQGRPARSFTAHELAALPIITLPQEANAHSVMMNWFEQAGVVVPRFHACNSISVVAALVRKGVGISLLPSSMFQDDLRSTALVVLSVNPAVPPMAYGAVYTADTHSSQASNSSILPEIAEFAREESWFQRRSPPGSPSPWPEA
jgi:DNA-binding transcriptional LysR family regulator